MTMNFIATRIFSGSMIRGAAIVAACVLISSCAVGPDYVKPAAETPQAWVGASTAEPANLAAWWETFGDPVLTGLIGQGQKSNLDLKIASERLRQSRAAQGQASGALWPSLNLGAGYQRSATNPPDDAGAAGSDSGSRSLYRAGFDSSWEIDVFGGARRGIEAAGAEVRASGEDLRDVLVSVAGDIGVNYLTLRGLQEQLAITRENLAAQESSVRITKKRFDAGFASELDLSNSQAQVAATRAQIPSLQAQINQTIYALGLLLGREPGALLAELSPEEPLPEVPDQVPAGLPSGLLQRRPDIRAAEARLHAATARIGVAKADLFPRFFLNGSASIQATHLESWSSSVYRLWSVGPSVSWNLFSGGATRARIEENRSRADQAFVEYQRAVLTALGEVESSWIAFDKETVRAASLRTAVENNRRAVELANRLYIEGQTDFLSVLDAQRSLYSAQQALSSSRSKRSTHLVSLYKALGGGWESAGPVE
ncbi:MAG TPA: efflux transporter outer membrane subunit [Deltaproteobacteria bacterium]|nr:efflux transporter outer membrane subunit [Deltaproteobacteria bacterium]